jgi:hypothetical protein
MAETERQTTQPDNPPSSENLQESAPSCSFVVLERLVIADIVLILTLYGVSFSFGSGSERLPMPLIIGMYVGCFSMVALLFARLFNGCYLRCCRACHAGNLSGTTKLGNVDLMIMKEIMSDPASIAVVVWMTILVVVDAVVPRTPMSVPIAIVGFVDVLTIVISDAVIQESRSFIRFHAVVVVVFLTLMILLAFFGSVEDATLFHLSYSQDDGNITTASTTNTKNNSECSTGSSNSITYTRTGVKRIIFIQLFTFVCPALKKILCRSSRTHMTFLEQPVARWEIMDKRELGSMSTNELVAERKVVKEAAERSMRVASACGSILSTRDDAPDEVFGLRGSMDFRLDDGASGENMVNPLFTTQLPPETAPGEAAEDKSNGI